MIFKKETKKYNVCSWGDTIELRDESSKIITLAELCDDLFNEYYVYKIKYFERIDQDLKQYGIIHKYNELNIYTREENENARL